MENEGRAGNTPGNQDALLMSNSRRFELFNAVISKKGISPTTGGNRADSLKEEMEETEGNFFSSQTELYLFPGGTLGQKSQK